MNRLKSAFIVAITITASGSAASLMACGLSQGVPLYQTDGGSSGNPTPTPQPVPTDQPEPFPPEPEPFPEPQPPPPSEQCPPSAPVLRSACDTPNVECQFVDGCAARPPSAPSDATYACLGGQWLITSPNYTVPCPADPPVVGTECGSCRARLPPQCIYNNPGCSALLVCDDQKGIWRQVSLPCPDSGVGP